MNSLPSVIQAIEFTETHLKEDIGVGDMAASVSYSLYHFCRIFNQATHLTPYEYLIRRRLAEAARELIENQKKVIDISYEYGFSSPETFARAFKRVHGSQPTEWKRNGVISRRLLLPRFSQAYLEHVNQSTFQKPSIELRESWSIEGILSPTHEHPEEIVQLWQLYQDEMLRENPYFSPTQTYGYLWYCQAKSDQGAFYLAGCLAEKEEPAWHPRTVKILPPHRWAKIIHQGAYSDIWLTRDFFYHTWLPASGFKQAAQVEIEERNALPGRDTIITNITLYIPVC